MLINKIESCRIHAGVIGLGYVGLPLMVAMANAGFKVTGIDICPEKLERLKHGISDVPDVPNTILEKLIKSEQIQVTNDFSVLRKLDTVNICVPTPLDENRIPDMQYIKTAVEKVAQNLHSEQLIILESTTYPGTTEEIVLPMLLSNSNSQQSNSLKVGHDFYLAYSPERIEPGNSTYFMTNTSCIDL